MENDGHRRMSAVACIKARPGRQ